MKSQTFCSSLPFPPFHAASLLRGVVLFSGACGLLVNAPFGEAAIYVSSAGLNANYNAGYVAEFDNGGNRVTTGAATYFDSLSMPYVAASGSTLFISDYAVSSVITADTTTGAERGFAILNYPEQIAVSGPRVFIQTVSGVSEYSITGQPINTSFISSGINSVRGIAASGGVLYVSSFNGSTSSLSGYDVTSGQLLSSVDTLGLGAMAIVGSDIYLAQGSTVGEYTTSGGVVNSALITGLDSAWGVAVLGSNLLVANRGNVNQAAYDPGYVSEYGLDGTVINRNFIPAYDNISNPTSIVVVPDAPEPGAGALLITVGTSVVAFGRFRAKINGRPCSVKG